MMIVDLSPLRKTVDHPGGLVLVATQTENPFFEIRSDEDLEKAAAELRQHPPGYDRIETALRLICLSGPCSPVPRLRMSGSSHLLLAVNIGIQQVDHIPPDIGFVNRGFEITAAPRSLLPLYKALSSATKGRIDSAIKRIGYANSRQDAGDAIVDAAIALETLLGEGARTELTFRLSLRAALLLEEKAAGRKQVQKLSKDLYAVRSAVVHTGGSSKATPELATWCVDLAKRVGTRILEIGGIPDWEMMELSGGADLGAIA